MTISIAIKNILILFLVSPFLFAQQKKIYLGADLSYVNEIEAGGGFYKNNGKLVDPYQLFKEKGCNIVRIRLWHSPKLNDYSGFEDVKKSIKRAKAQKMEVLLDIHYSDIWADPDHQSIPKAWQNISNMKVLGDSIYNYTLNSLLKLNKENLLPEMVQVGNETNTEILQPEGKKVKEFADIDWKRNSYLFNKGIAGVREASRISKKKMPIMLHIAQPENALKWFAMANKNGIKDYDWIGISYYPLWSTMKFDDLPKAIKTLTSTYKKQLMVVETSYPYTLKDIDKANNILDKKSLLPQYPATPQGQLNYMIDLTKITLKAGGSGVIYWEPAWVTSSSKTFWGEGSHWDNATFFDSANDNEALPVFNFFNLKKYTN